MDGRKIITTIVYAKCDVIDKLDFPNDIYSLSDSMRLPWLLGGDFNVILDEDEKIRGLPIYPQEY